VWINGFNEPGNGYNLQSITDQQVAIYNGVRSVSPDKFVAMEEPSGGNPGLVGTSGKGYDGSAGMPPSAYANMHNIVWTPHFYGWIAKYSTDPVVVAQAFQGSVQSASGVAAAQSIRSADGLVPVVIGEFGDSTTGTDIDADGSVVVDVVGKSGKGFLAWHWHASNNAGDMLTTDNAGTLTPYGKQVQGLILRAAQIEDGQTPAPTQTPVPTTAPPSGSGTPGTWLDGSVSGMPYKVLLPNGVTPSGGYKLMVYEHQLDMGIPNNVPQLVSWMNNWFNSTTFRVAHPDVIVVAPLCDNTGDTSGNSYNFGGVSSSVTKGRDQVLSVVQAMRNTYNINPKQITITGNSMGGLGTWELIAYKPDIFCAAMPLAGSNYTRDQVQTANALMQKPIWAVHGSSDTNVPIAWDRNMYASIHGAGGAMKYTELSMGHDVWDTVYPDPQYLGWLLAQSM
jgi:predicted esterase